MSVSRHLRVFVQLPLLALALSSPLLLSACESDCEKAAEKIEQCLRETCEQNPGDTSCLDLEERVVEINARIPSVCEGDYRTRSITLLNMTCADITTGQFERVVSSEEIDQQAQ
jgi:hypothetical protein